MKIQIISDVHREFSVVDSIYKDLVETESDVIVIAGDYAGQGTICKDLIQLQRDSRKDIIFTPGNHEYYGTSRRLLDPELLDVHNQNDNVHVLIEGGVNIGGVCFLGSTGWWDGSNGPINMTCKHGLNDFRYIYDLCNEGNDDGIVWGNKSYNFFKEIFECGNIYEIFNGHKSADRLVCVTHHMPSKRCISPKFYGSPINTCFANDWTDMIEKYQPDLWICGHTHDSFDFKINNTRMVCNPQGYPSVYRRMTGYDKAEDTWVIENKKFNSKFVIEL